MHCVERDGPTELDINASLELLKVIEQLHDLWGKSPRVVRYKVKQCERVKDKVKNHKPKCCGCEGLGSALRGQGEQ